MTDSITSLDFKLDIRPPYRDVRGRFEKAEAAMKGAKRDVLKKQGGRFERLMRREAPGKKLPNKLNVQYFFRGTHMGFEVHGPMPLTRFIQRGTKPHIIRAKNASALRFFWPKVNATTFVPKGGGFPTHMRADNTFWIGKGYVNHPGTKPNKFIGRAFRRWLPGARRDLKKISDVFARTFESGDTKVFN